MRKEAFALKILEYLPYDKNSKVSMEDVIKTMNSLKIQLNKQGYLYLSGGKTKKISYSKTKS